MKDLRKLEGIGMINVTESELFGGIDAYINIERLADTWKEPVNKAIEQEIDRFNAENVEEMEKYHLRWSNEGVNLKPSIQVTASEGKDDKISQLEYRLFVLFEDKENDILGGCVCFDLDMEQNRRTIIGILAQACKNELEKLR